MKFRRLIIFVCLMGFVISGCQPAASMAVAAPAQEPTLLPTATNTPATTPFNANTPAPTATVSPLPSATPTPAWVYQQGTITCPILLYHRIDYPPNPKTPGARYYVSPENFAAQMKALHDWGYTTIPLSALVQAIAQGAALPSRPIVITFDDGYDNVYKTAYPIMQQYGFTGINFIVADRLYAEGFMNPDQLRELSWHGWEIGVHGMSHIDLTLHHEVLDREVSQARATLEGMTGLRADTLAYPFATYDDEVINAVQKADFVAAVGVGNFYSNSADDLYYLSRIEIRYNYDLARFFTILPWGGRP